MKKALLITLLALAVGSRAFCAGVPELVESEVAPMVNLFEDSPPVITDVSVYPKAPFDDESVTVSARVYADENAASMPVKGVQLWYRFDGDTVWIKFDMLKSPPVKDGYFGTIAPKPGSRKIIYSIIAEDIGGNIGAVIPAAQNIDTAKDDSYLWAYDSNEEDKLVPKELDVLGLGAARDADNLHLVIKTEGAPNPGNLSTTGANFYFVPFFPPGEGMASFLGGSGKILGYLPLASSLLGIPKFGLFNLKDIISGNKNVPKTGVTMTKGKDRLSFTVPLKSIGEGNEWVAGVAAGRLKTATGIEPVEASSFMRLILNGGEVAVKSGADRKPAKLRAGAAKNDISSPIGTPLAGYGDRVGVPSKAIHDPLMATAVVIESDNRYYCFAGLDFFYMRLDFYNDVAKRLRKATGMPDDCVFMGASHSHHASGALNPELSILGGKFQPAVYEKVIGKVADTLIQAYKNMKPAKIGVGWIEMDKDKVTAGNRKKSGGLNDRIIGVIKVDTIDNKPIATVFNHSGHPTGIASKTMQQSSDFVGPARNAIEKQGGGVAVFFNGSVGDHSARCPANCGKDDFEKVKGTGEAIANYVVKLRKLIKAEDKATFRGVTQWLLLNKRREAYSLEKALVINGKYVFLTMPGELFFDPFGSQFREQAKSQGYDQLFVLGLTDDGLAYIYPEELYYSHDYEASYSAFGPKLSPFLTDNAINLIKELGPAKP